MKNMSAARADAARGSNRRFVNVGSTCLAVRVGRRPLLVLAPISVLVSLALLGLNLSLDATGGVAGLLVTICLALSVASFTISMGAVLWQMIAGLYLSRMRGTVASVAAPSNGDANFLVALTFPVVLATFRGSGAL